MVYSVITFTEIYLGSEGISGHLVKVWADRQSAEDNVSMAAGRCVDEKDKEPMADKI